MADFAGLSAAFSSIKSVIDLARTAQDAQLAMKINAELAGIQGKLIDVQNQAVEIQQENHRLRGELEKLKSYKHHHSVMWRTREGGEDGPFCPICVSEGRELPLTVAPSSSQSEEYFVLYCAKGHGQPGNRAHGLLPAPGPSYRVPKDLLPKNYYFQPEG